MPAGNPEAYNDPIVQQLIERGLLATGGNIRPIPFGGAQAGNGSANQMPPSPEGAPVATPNGDGTYTVDDGTGNPQTIDPRDVAQQLGEDPNSDLSWLAAAIAGASGALIGSQFGRRKPNAPADPLAPLPENAGSLPNGADDIIEGEFTVLDDPKQIGVEPKALPAPPNQLQQQEAAKALTQRKRATNPPQPSAEQSRIRLPDEFSDLTPEELQRARALAEQLVMNRQRGNVQAYHPYRKREARTGQPRGRGAGPYPTSPNFQTENPEDIIGNVVRALRDMKALKSLGKVAR